MKVDEWEEVRENGELLENAIINTERFLADWAALRPTEQRLLVDQISWLPCTPGQSQSEFKLFRKKTHEARLPSSSTRFFW